MGASYWGCDIGGGGDNTYVARIVFDESGSADFWAYKYPGSTLKLATHIWSKSGVENAPIFLAVDAVLSHDLDSAKGWRPADQWLKKLINRRLSSKPGYSTLVSPSAFMGHRHLELAELFGAYFLVAETHPASSLVFGGADLADVSTYKKKGATARQRSKARGRLGQWLTSKWFPAATTPLASDGQLDALVCAMVAAQMGGRSFRDLSLFTPVLEDSPVPNAGPRATLVGPAPFYVSRCDDTYDLMVVADVHRGPVGV
jgi:predicted nuclease with RNAse H fold